MLPIAAVLVCALCPPPFSLSNGPAQSRAPSRSGNAPAITAFLTRVQDYASLHRRVVGRIGALDPVKSPKDIAARETALGEAIRAERQGARRGDIFTPEAARLFTTIIRREFAQRSRLAVKNQQDSQDELPDFAPMVNQIYPTAYPLATFPPGLLAQLPALPKPLEYRFVRSSLILRDSEANLIVDVLPDAAPALRR